MKKIFCFVGFLMTFNVLAQLNMGAIINGQTIDSVCFLYSISGDPEIMKSVSCGHRNGSTGTMALNSQTQLTIAQFVGSGKWNLAATFFVQKNNVTTFVFTKK
jgi:hypothetical protein